MVVSTSRGSIISGSSLGISLLEPSLLSTGDDDDDGDDGEVVKW